MSIFLTGATGYLGSYIAAELLKSSKENLCVLVRAKGLEEAHERLWRSLQLHMDFEWFWDALQTRMEIYLGDLTQPQLGLNSQSRKKLIKTTDSIIHCGASLNRKSDKACFNVNLRGTLSVITLAREVQDDHGLKRFSDISTVAVAGKRKNEIVSEDHMVDWGRSDYDPYARTKKFCEHMVSELLPDVSHVVFRPSIILGDSRFPQTTQFDMVRAFVWLAQLPILPFSKNWRADIACADYVSRAVVKIHLKEKLLFDSYNLSSGAQSVTYREIIGALKKEMRIHNLFLPWLESPFTSLTNLLANTPRSWRVSPFASLLKVFLPYLTFNTVFDNSRVQKELGETPPLFSCYASGLFRFARNGNFTYPYKPWPTEKRLTKQVRVA